MACTKKVPEGFPPKTASIAASQMIFESEAMSADGDQIHENEHQPLISARNATLRRYPPLVSTSVTP
jgi:hypothetical protein